MLKTPAVAAIMTWVLLLCATPRAHSVAPSVRSTPTPLSTLATALSGKWDLDVRFEPTSATGGKAIEGAGEESWSLGPGGINLIEQEHIPSPGGESFVMGVVWWDATRHGLAGMECNSQLPFTCDLKGALNDVTITWDGKKFQIDEIETHDGRRTVWHEYWTDITPRSFVQSGDVTQPDGSTVRFMNIRGRRVKKLTSLDRD